MIGIFYLITQIVSGYSENYLYASVCSTSNNVDYISWQKTNLTETVEHNVCMVEIEY